MGFKTYGVFNVNTKKFQFGIREDTKYKAFKKLEDKIGKDCYKYRFEIREIEK